VRTPAEKRNLDLIDEYSEKNAKLFGLLDLSLDGREYLGGSSLTLADIALGPLTYRWFTLPIKRPEYHNLSHWYGMLRQRPAFVEHVVNIGLS
jgi:glutathione S-transferase